MALCPGPDDRPRVSPFVVVLVQDTAWPGYETIPALIIEGYDTFVVGSTISSSASGWTAPTSMAGLNCRTPSFTAWPFIRQGLDDALIVDEAADIRAAHDLAALGVRAGPCGAAPLAALRAALTGPGCQQRREHLGVDVTSTVVLLVTEGDDSKPVPELPRD